MERLRGRNYLRDKDINGRIILSLKSIFKKERGCVDWLYQPQETVW
jgi:hypothetical protein